MCDLIDLGLAEITAEGWRLSEKGRALYCSAIDILNDKFRGHLDTCLPEHLVTWMLVAVAHFDDGKATIDAICQAAKHEYTLTNPIGDQTCR